MRGLRQGVGESKYGFVGERELGKIFFGKVGRTVETRWRGGFGGRDNGGFGRLVSVVKAGYGGAQREPFG